MDFFGLWLCFPNYSLETILSFVPETIQLSRFPTRKMYSISQKALKDEFSKMEDAGNIEPPKSSFSTPTTSRTIRVG